MNECSEKKKKRRKEVFEACVDRIDWNLISRIKRLLCLAVWGFAESKHVNVAFVSCELETHDAVERTYSQCIVSGEYWICRGTKIYVDRKFTSLLCAHFRTWNFAWLFPTNQGSRTQRKRARLFYERASISRWTNELTRRLLCGHPHFSAEAQKNLRSARLGTGCLRPNFRAGSRAFNRFNDKIMSHLSSVVPFGILYFRQNNFHHSPGEASTKFCQFS